MLGLVVSLVPILLSVGRCLPLDDGVEASGAVILVDVTAGCAPLRVERASVGLAGGIQEASGTAGVFAGGLSWLLPCGLLTDHALHTSEMASSL